MVLHIKKEGKKMTEKPKGEKCKLCQKLAKAVISIAEDGNMPDSYFESDSRIKLARKVLW